MFLVNLFGCLLILNCFVNADSPCKQKEVSSGYIVCVCSADYCDSTTVPETGTKGQYHVFTSSKAGLRFSRENGQFQTKKFSLLDVLKVQFTVQRTQTYQDIVGFGGAFTDAVGINLQQLSQKTQDQLIRSYFAKDGLRYNLGRVPMGGCDFSTHPYTYQDLPENDPTLSNFSLTQEDFIYKIPNIKKAKELSPDLRLIAAAWSPPLWMKNGGTWGGFSSLKPEYYGPWANYHIKFLDAYAAQGVPLWAFSTGNEPLNGDLGFVKFMSLGWTPANQGKWVAENLGPALRGSATHKDVKLFALDDQRINLPLWINQMNAYNSTALDFIDGIALHWYLDFIVPTFPLDITHSLYPTKMLLGTEACAGDRPWEEAVTLGSWDRGERYIKYIIQDLQNWVAGWLDWNLALDQQGGPNYVGNFVDAPIIVNNQTDEFYKQPIYYALGHFSKFIPVGSKRVQLDTFWAQGLDYVAFKRPDDAIAIVLYNSGYFNIDTIINDETRGGQFTLQVPAKSFQTVLYW